MFEVDLRVLRNRTCADCDARIKHPLLPWIVGSKYADESNRILFIGKPHRGMPGTVLASGIIDPTLAVDSLWLSGWPYWSYTREIAERMYGPDALDHIALTNIVKCTNTGAEDGSPSADDTSYEMADRCVRRLGALWREIDVLKPHSIVFYTFGLYRKLLRDLPFAIEPSIREVTPIDHTVGCRNKRLGWWERVCDSHWGEIRTLVVGHPERKGRTEYIDLLANWLARGSRS